MPRTSNGSSCLLYAPLYWSNESSAREAPLWRERRCDWLISKRGLDAGLCRIGSRNGYFFIPFISRPSIPGF